MSALPVEPRPLARYDGVDAMLEAARAGLERLSPRAAFQEAVIEDALLVDIRPAAQRAAYGGIAPWLEPRIVERNVLEWRFDPRSEARLPEAAYDARVIVLCQEGYTSSLAAHALRELGVRYATDVVGGYAEWQRLGLPVVGPVPL